MSRKDISIVFGNYSKRRIRERVEGQEKVEKKIRKRKSKMKIKEEGESKKSKKKKKGRRRIAGKEE